ncbi:MAG: hypothetical protein R3199_11105 [Gemmatimonadota bacterium]|nr:hypothetical protein [Gemmatimonadota bacterium]
MLNRLFIRDFEAIDRFEAFLVSAVTAILAIRLFLALTGYPQLGGDTLHLAHLLWGGVLMLAAFVVAFSFLGRAADRTAAILGGLGFGTFLDEVGKFVTRDYDYFYEPAVAIMYVTIVAVFLVAHAVQRRGERRPVEYLLNALRETEELALHDLDEEERRRALAWLERSDPEHPLVPVLVTALRAVEPAPASRSVVERFRERARALYRRIVALPGFDTGLVLFFVGQLLFKLAFGAILVFVIGYGADQVLDVRFVGVVAERVTELSGLEIAQLAASGLSAVFVALGVVRLRRSRLAAYRQFERAILVSILLVQVFSFYREQFAALVELGFNLTLLVTLRMAIRLEGESQLT